MKTIALLFLLCLTGCVSMSPGHTEVIPLVSGGYDFDTKMPQHTETP